MAARHGSFQHPREQLLRRRVLPIEQYASEHQRGVHKGLTRYERRKLYGSDVVPIHVPLDPGESEAQHERRFLIWLSRRSLTLADLQGNANDERSYRILFAKIKTKMYVQRHGLTSAKRSRVQHEEEEEDDEEDEDEDEDDYEDDSDEEGDEEYGVERRYVSETKSVLLRTRVITAQQYRAEVERDAVRKPTAQEKIARYGSLNVPIPVPLFPGESEDDYERKLVSFLASRRTSLAKLASNPGKERSIRMNFARARVGGHLKGAQIAALVKKARRDERVGDENDAFHANTSRSVEIPTGTTPESQAPGADATNSGFPTKCTLRPPPIESDDTAIPKAYLACGCRKCLLRCTSRLVRQVAGLQSDLADSQSTTATSNETSDAVMDLTRDTDSQASGSVTPGSARGSQTTSGIDVAKMLHMMTLIKSRRRGRSINTTRSSRERTTDDPIEQQLRRQYDEVNERVVENERVLETASLELQGAALSCHDQLQEASMTQDENLELRAYIEEEKDHRDAALAMLVVYTWRHACEELQERLAAPAAADVAHVTRACHRKCALLASELSGFETQAASVRQQLDAVLSGESREEHETRRLEQLQRLGEELTRVEQAMQANHATRKRELVTLLHFDGHVRRLVQELLREATIEQ